MNIKLFYSSVSLQHFAYGIIIPTLAVWQYQLGLTFTEIGIIQTVGILTVLLSEVPSSYFADRIGRKTTLVLAFLISILSYVFLINADSFISFLIAQILFSLGMAFFSGTQESLLHDLVGYNNKMTKFLGKMSIFDESSTILGMLASSLLITIYSIQVSFIAGLVAMLLGFFSILFINVNPKEDAEEGSIKTKPIKLKSWHIFVIVFFFSVMALRGDLLFQSSFAITNTALAILGGVYTFAKLFSILGSAIAHKVEDALGFKQSMLLTLALQILSFSLLLTINIWITILALAIYFFSENVFRNIRDAWILHNSPKNLRATFISSVSLASAVLALAIKPLVGYGIDNALYYGVIIIAGMKIVGGLLFLVGKLRRFRF